MLKFYTFSEPKFVQATVVPPTSIKPGYHKSTLRLAKKEGK